MPLTVSNVTPAERRVDLAPQVVHVLVDDVGAAIVGEIPDRLDDLRAAEHVAGVPEEQLQQGELLGRELELGSVTARPLGGRIQLEVALGEDDGPGPVVAAAQRPQPRGQFQQAERLDEIVVRAGVEPAHPVAHAVPRGHHQHRGPDPGLPEPPAKLEPVEAGQHDIQDDRPIGILGRQPQALRAVLRDVDRVALLRQPALEEPGHPNLILDYQHPHAWRLRGSR